MAESKTSVDDIFARRQRWGKILLAIAALLLLILSLLPEGIRMGTTSWLHDHGVKHAEIDNVDLNLFNGTFAIEGLVADEGLKIGRLFVDVDWWPLFSHKVFIRLIEVKGIKADLQQQVDGVWQLSTIKLDERSPEPEKPVAEEKNEPWQLVLNHIDVADVKLHAKGSLENKPFELSIPLDTLNIKLQKVEDTGAQSLSNRVRLGMVTFDGLGYRFENHQLVMEQTLFLPAMGSDIVADLKLQNMKLSMAELSLLDTAHEVMLVGINTIKLDQMNLSGARTATFDTLSIEGIKLPAVGDNSMGKIGAINLHQADLDLSGVYKLKKVAIHDLQASLKKLKDGKIQVLGRLLDRADGTVTNEVKAEENVAEKVVLEKEAPDQVTPASPKSAIFVDEFMIEKGSSVAFRDESLFPPFETAMEVDRFTLAPIDLSGKESGKLDLLLKLNKNGSLAVSGDLGMNAGDLRADMKVALKNFDMPGLTGFVEGNFGQVIKTGQLNLHSTIKTDGQKIEAKNNVLIRKLVLERAKQPGKVKQRLGMPVDMAIDMLRDDRGDISMNVPISGRLDDPNVNVSDIINKAMVSSMKSGAMTYAKLLLQPYGAIYMAAEFAVGVAQDAAKPKLTPIQFAPRSTVLSVDMADYASKIATLMKDKTFRLEICGVATRLEGAIPEAGSGQESFKKAENPQPMSDEALLKMGEARSDAVMKAIQGQGIAAERLFNCRPNIDDEKAMPRVELILD